VLPAPTYVISDAHLGFANAEVERNIVRFLRYLAGTGGSLIINGDLFEFWFEWRTVVPRSSVRVLAALADLRDAGVPVLMVAGNHDCWGGSVLRDDAGVDYVVGPWVGTAAGWHARFEHGDGLRPREDRRYRALRRVLRNPMAIRSFRWIHPDLATRVASHSSHASRTYAARDGGAGLRAAAGRAIAADPTLDVIAYGHSHVPALERVGRAVYANAGSWLDAPTFLRLTPDRIAMRKWTGSGESADLDALERMPQETLP
jgi:UDP-2,3-diacylglucosamine hydrolase